MLFLSYYAAGGELITDRVVDAAASIELIHAASLVHDDILDDAETRRGLLSAPVLMGEGLSILFGDALFTEAFWLASRLPNRVADLSREAVRAMVQGEAREIVHREGTWSPEEAQTVAREKTASVMALATGTGAVLTQAPEEHIAALERFGMLLGIAFQAIDDALDITGEQEATGKPTGTDARIGAPNLAEALGEDGARAAREMAEAWIEEAEATLSVLDETEERELLTSLARFIVDRSW
jgi:geranylgeranyl pyrophosphate synthase